MARIDNKIFKRVAPIARRIDAFLKQSGLPAKAFFHDMTFGNGMGAMLHSNDELVARYYSAKDIPFVYTNKEGRTLKNGAYLFKYFIDPIPEYEKLDSWVKKSVSYQHAISIAVNEIDHQQLFTFVFENCSELQFIQHMVNHFYLYQQYIQQYQIAFKDVIDNERESHQSQFPLSDMQLINNADFSLFTNENKQEIVHPKNILPEVANVLSPQQMRCLSFLSEGMTAREIAAKMALSYRTVQHYILDIRRKLKVRNTKELIAKYAIL